MGIYWNRWGVIRHVEQSDGDNFVIRSNLSKICWLTSESLQIKGRCWRRSWLLQRRRHLCLLIQFVRRLSRFRFIGVCVSRDRVEVSSSCYLWRCKELIVQRLSWIFEFTDRFSVLSTWSWIQLYRVLELQKDLLGMNLLLYSWLLTQWWWVSFLHISYVNCSLSLCKGVFSCSRSCESDVTSFFMDSDTADDFILKLIVLMTSIKLRKLSYSFLKGLLTSRISWYRTLRSDTDKKNHTDNMWQWLFSAIKLNKIMLLKSRGRYVSLWFITIKRERIYWCIDTDRKDMDLFWLCYSLSSFDWGHISLDIPDSLLMIPSSYVMICEARFQTKTLRFDRSRGAKKHGHLHSR